MTQHDEPSSSQQGRFSHLWTPKLNIPFPRFTKKSIIIAVMGMTGAGKTSFIKYVTELDEMEVGHSLKSCKYILRSQNSPNPSVQARKTFRSQLHTSMDTKYT